jgi:hypothetical protein
MEEEEEEEEEVWQQKLYYQLKLKQHVYHSKEVADHQCEKIKFQQSLKME